MGFFDRFRRKKEPGPVPATQEEADPILRQWQGAHKAAVQYYADPAGNAFGCLTLTEGVDTILPRNPRAEVDGVPLERWKVVFVGLERGNPGGPRAQIVGEADYRQVAEELFRSAVVGMGELFLICGLTRAQQQALALKYPFSE